MSVLPKSTSFLSFFIVFAVLFLCTVLLGLNLRKILQGFKAGTITTDAPLLGRILNYIRDYVHLLNPYNKKFTYEKDHFPKNDWELHQILRKLIFELPIFILRRLVLPEICMPIDQYILYQYRNNPHLYIYYHPVWVVRDIIRGVLIPAWIGVAAGIVVYLVVLDILVQCLRQVARLV
jgi:hypothetical protein